VIIGGCING
jgi:WD40 repeat protein